MKKIFIILLFSLFSFPSFAQVPLDNKNGIMDLQASFNMIDAYLQERPFINLSAENNLGQRVVMISIEKRANSHYVFSIPSEEMLGQFLSIDVQIKDQKIYLDRYFTKPNLVDNLERLTKVDFNHNEQKPMRFLKELIQLKISIWEFITYADLVKRQESLDKKTSLQTRKI